VKNTKKGISGYALTIAAAGILSLGGSYLYMQDHQATAAETAQAATPPQAMPVSTATIKPQQVQIWQNFSGHVVAVDQAEIRPQVSGRITEIKFTDGQHVEKGDILIVIDPRPYEARLSQAKAALEAAKTQSNLAAKEYQRALKLINTDAISQSMLDERTNDHQAAIAAEEGARAALQSAEIDLDYAYVKAPISGKISRAEITEGNLVQTGANAPLLTAIVSDEKVYVDFEVDERTYLSTVPRGKNANAQDIAVRLKLTGSDDEFQGVIHSFDNRIDPTTGTIRARAIFDNPEGMLLPGMSVSVFMGGASDAPKIVVSERAIGTDQDRKFVYVIGDAGIVEYREVTIGDSIAGQRVILSGLMPGDTVITEGLVRIRPGMPVTPKEAMPKQEQPETQILSEKE
jgi:multidrug efflux system membrane fusion protein